MCRSFIRKLVKTSTCRSLIRNWVKTSTQKLVQGRSFVLSPSINTILIKLFHFTCYSISKALLLLLCLCQNNKYFKQVDSCHVDKKSPFSFPIREREKCPQKKTHPSLCNRTCTSLCRPLEIIAQLFLQDFPRGRLGDGVHKLENININRYVPQIIFKKMPLVTNPQQC